MSRVAARAAAGKVPPIAIVGTASTSALRTTRAIVATVLAERRSIRRCEIEVADGRKQHGSRGRRHGDDQLELRVQDERARMPIGPRPEQETAHAQGPR